MTRLNMIPIVGLYQPDQYEHVISAFGPWSAVCDTVCVYYRPTQESPYARMKDEADAWGLKLMGGVEVSYITADGRCVDFRTLWNPGRFTLAARAVKQIKSQTKQRQVFCVLEPDPDKNTLYNGTPDPGKHTPAVFPALITECFKELTGLNCLFDMYTVHPEKPWDENLSRATMDVLVAQNRAQARWPRPKFKWAAAYPGTYLPTPDDANQWPRLRQSHIDIVGAGNYHDRLFAGYEDSGWMTTQQICDYVQSKPTGNCTYVYCSHANWPRVAGEFRALAA